MRRTITVELALESLTMLTPSLQKHIFFGVYPFVMLREPSSVDDVMSSMVILRTDDDIRNAVQARRDQLLKQVTTARELLYCLNKPARLDVLHLWSTVFEIDADEYNAMLRDAWIATEFPHQMNTRDLVAMFDESEPDRIMTKDECAIYRDLPKVVRVYRGTQSSDAKIRGLSWTMDPKVATWFANRYGSSSSVRGVVYTAEIPRSCIFAYFGDRSEAEVVLNPRYLRDVHPWSEGNT